MGDIVAHTPTAEAAIRSFCPGEIFSQEWDEQPISAVQAQVRSVTCRTMGMISLPGRIRLRAVFAMFVLGLTATVAPPGSDASASTDAEPEYDDVIDITFPSVPSEVDFADWYDAPRSGGRVHMATDIMGPKLTPVFAAVGGVVTRMPMVDDQYGYRLVVEGDDGRSYSYLHLNNDSPGTDDGAGTAAQAYAPGVALNGRVERGQHIGYMGDSGNAEATPSHVHFAISDPSVVDPYGSNNLDPYPSLNDAIARGDIPADTASPAPESAPRPAPGSAPDLARVCGTTVRAQSFSDLPPSNVHSQAVECLAALEVTFGTGSGRYTPSANVTRLQMASFTARLLEAGGVALPAAPADAFDDDDGTVHEPAVNQLVALRVIRMDTGEVGRDFEGEVDMKRDRMAAWMARAYGLIAGQELPSTSVDYFGDDSALHHADINRLAEAGIVQGTSAGVYSPRIGVRRDQMGSYLARTLAAAKA